MFRPAYWFGLGSSAAIQPTLSLANQPAMSDSNKTATIVMKGWKFADGQTIDAESLMFFLNMYRADPTAYCGFNGKYGIPNMVKSASGTGNTVTIHFTTSVNPYWILYNYPDNHIRFAVFCRAALSVARFPFRTDIFHCH